jgi:undecaprenyl-diphosphatase
MIHRKLISKINICGKDLFFMIFILILGLIAVWSYFNLDQGVFSLLCRKPVKWDDNFWVDAFTYLGKAYVLIGLLLIWYLSTGQKRPVFIALLALVISFLAVMPLKVGVRRPRPNEVVKANAKMEQKELHSHTSFPSGDTAAVFTVATVIAYFVRWPLTCLFLAVSAGIALLRVTAMAHYPSDVFAGGAIGSFAGLLAMQIGRRFAKGLRQPPQYNLD